MIARTGIRIFALLLAISASTALAIAQDQTGNAKNKAAAKKVAAQRSDPVDQKPAETQPPSGTSSEAAQEPKDAAADKGSVFYEIKIKDVTGEKVDFKKYHGKVVLVVNVASKCGFTGQFKPLQALHKEYKSSGFEVLAFPCNQFGKQEPLTEQQIKKFCHEKFNVEFDVFSKIEVKGKGQQELFARLTPLNLGPAGKGNVKWNFEKFLVGKDGVPIARFRSNVSPRDKRIVSRIRAELGLPQLKEDDKPAKQEKSSEKKSSEKKSSKKKAKQAEPPQQDKKP